MTTQAFNAQTLPLHGLRLIEASAGTGKTFSLAGLYLRLIVEKQASVRDVLVMTFTRAATQELRERIRARLADAARIARQPESAIPGNAEHDFTRAVLDHADEAPEALARRLADAAARVDEATIVTIHGFAQRAATENAFESALAFDRGDAVDDPEIYQQATADYWRAHVFDGDHAHDVLALWPSPEALYQTLRPLLHRPHVQLAGIDHSRLTALQAALADTWPGTADALARALREAFDADALLKSGALYQALAAEEDIAASMAALDSHIQSAIAEQRVPTLPNWTTTLAQPGPQFKKAAKAQALAEPLSDLPALAVLAALQPLARLVAIERAANAIRQRAAERKVERRQYSYDDLIIALHDALVAPRTGAELADALHARWPYALVDEFQDTDPVQYASLARIYLAGDGTPRAPGALLLIGDPKQAIYGFRGGDIYAYLAAADAADAAGDARYTLTTNFRSTQPVLDAIEALYRLPGDAPFVVPDIDFPHVEAGRRAGDLQLVSRGKPHAALTLWRLTGGEYTQKNGKQKNPAKDIDQSRLVAETVAAIAALLDAETSHWHIADGTARAVAPRDIAILVNNHREASLMQGALAAAGITAVCQHRDSVYASAEADDLRRVLRAMAGPDDAGAVRAAQPTALIGKRLADLIALADDDNAMQQAIERFHGLHETWARRGVLTALEALFVEVAPRVLRLVDGERRMSNYLQLGELLADAEAECFSRAHLIHWLDEHIRAAREGHSAGLEDTGQLRLESDAALVRISTVHAAKGLQYPIVFLPFAPWLGTRADAHKPPLIFHPTTEHSPQAYIDLVGDTPAHVKQAVIEARSEALRLLYVALTRAEQALIIGWRAPDDSPSHSALADLLHRDGAHADDALSTLQQAAADAVVIRDVDITAPMPVLAARHNEDSDALGHARTDTPAPRPRWSTYSFSRLAHAPVDNAPESLPERGAADELASTTSEASLPADDAAVPALDTRLSGVRFGSAVHDLLEAHVGQPNAEPWPVPGNAATPSQRQAVMRTLRHYGLLEDNENDARINDTLSLIARTLYTPLPDIGPLAALPPSRCLAEMEFMLRLSGHRLDALIHLLRSAGYLPAALGGRPEQVLHGLMQGFIDLVVEADGAFYILDYKTNNLGATAAAYRDAELARAMGRAHYDLQYLIYSVALHRHLKRCLGDSYDPAVHWGGVQYLFVRALDGESDTGVFIDRPDMALIEALDALFDGANPALEASA